MSIASLTPPPPFCSPLSIVYVRNEKLNVEEFYFIEKFRDFFGAEIKLNLRHFTFHPTYCVMCIYIYSSFSHSLSPRFGGYDVIYRLLDHHFNMPLFWTFYGVAKLWAKKHSNVEQNPEKNNEIGLHILMRITGAIP